MGETSIVAGEQRCYLGQHTDGVRCCAQVRLGPGTEIWQPLPVARTLCSPCPAVRAQVGQLAPSPRRWWQSATGWGRASPRGLVLVGACSTTGQFHCVPAQKPGARCTRKSVRSSGKIAAAPPPTKDQLMASLMRLSGLKHRSEAWQRRLGKALAAADLPRAHKAALLGPDNLPVP